MVKSRRTLARSLAVATALAAPFCLQAQSIQGVVTVEPDAHPLGGAHVVLLDGSGAPVVATLSREDGSFALTAPTPGPHRVLVETPGYGRVDTPVEVPDAGLSTDVSLAPTQPDVDLPKVKADARCRIPEGAGPRITALWREAAKAFRVVEWARQSGLVQFETETWYRSMEPKRLRVLEEEHTPRPGFHATGRLPSPMAQELARDGFIWGGGPGEAVSFHGPDATTLLDPVFAETHCLGFDPKGPEEGWVGLTFSPRDNEARDVEGTLWIDGATGAPRRLEYRYTTLPWPIKTDKVGGGMDMERLDDGAWIVRRWWLRMPRVGVEEVRITQWDPPRRRFSLTGVVEEGGVVTRVRYSDGQIETLSPPAP